MTTYDIYDCNPAEGGSAWPDTSDGPDADDYTNPDALADSVLEYAVSEAGNCSDYAVGDRLYVIVRLSDGTNRTDSRELTADDLDVDASDVGDWETVASYVSCVYGPEGDQPGDCETRIGEVRGVWFVDDGDDSVRADTYGPFASREEAEAKAEELAKQQHEGQEGEDADGMRTRLLVDAAGEPDEEGNYCVYWDTVGDDAHVVERYSTQEAASAAADLKNEGLHRHNPGGNLLCGYEIRELVDGEWQAVGSV